MGREPGAGGAGDDEGCGDEVGIGDEVQPASRAIRVALKVDLVGMTCLATQWSITLKA